MPKGARKYAQDEASSRADGGAGLSARQHRRAGLGTPRGDHYGREGRRLLRRRHLPGEKASGARADRPELLRMIGDLQPGEVVIAEKIDRISRLPLPEAERLVASIQAKGARLAVPGVVDLSDLAAEAQGVAKIVLEAVQIMLFRLALQMARDDYEDRRERQRQGIELARQAGRYKGRRADPKRRAQVDALRKSGYSINKTAELAGYSAAQVKRIWAEVSQAEAKQHGAFVEDALTEADALAAVGQDERQEERA